VDGCILTVAARANNGEQLALADGFGRVRLLRYPAVNDDQVSKKVVEEFGQIPLPVREKKDYPALRASQHRVNVCW